MTKRGEPLAFLRVVKHGENCTLWPFSLTKRGGYGQVYYKGRVRKAHQIAFIFAHGREPHGLVRHTCDRPACVNPAHLIEGTSADNMRDAMERGRLPRYTDRPNGKVTPLLAEEIRQSPETGRAIARRLGLSEGLVSEIRTGKRRYDRLTRPWRTVIGPIHPDDEHLKGQGDE